MAVNSLAFIYVSMLGRSDKKSESNSLGYRLDSLPLQISASAYKYLYFKVVLCYLSIYGGPVQNLFQYNQTTLAEWSNDCPVSKDAATSKPVDVSRCCGHRFPFVASLETLCYFLKPFLHFCLIIEFVTYLEQQMSRCFSMKRLKSLL